MEQARAKLVELEAERTTVETAVAKLKREKVQLDETHRGLEIVEFYKVVLKSLEFNCGQ